jgi:hypothetical protein
VAGGQVVLSGGKTSGHHFNDALHAAGLRLLRIKMLLQPLRDGAHVLHWQGADGGFNFGNCAHIAKLATDAMLGKSRFGICQFF